MLMVMKLREFHSCNEWSQVLLLARFESGFSEVVPHWCSLKEQRKSFLGGERGCFGRENQQANIANPVEIGEKNSFSGVESGRDLGAEGGVRGVVHYAVLLCVESLLLMSLSRSFYRSAVVISMSVCRLSLKVFLCRIFFLSHSLGLNERNHF